jgi:RNA-binding motif X-linked protein 2
MNSIRQTQALNDRELELCTPPSASWHKDYADTAFIYIGGLPFELSEGDIITIFSQYGEPVFINLVRDKETGKSKGFCFLKYEDQRSCDLAVDNLGGANVMGRVLRVDHTRYKKKDDEDLRDNTHGESYIKDEDKVEIDLSSDATDGDKSPQRPRLKEEEELAALMNAEDDDDPMRGYLIEKKKEEVEKALRRLNRKDRHHKSSKHRSHRQDRDDEDRDHKKRHRDDDGGDRRQRTHRSRSEDSEERRRRRRRERERKRDEK